MRDYLKILHWEGLNRFALVDNSLAANFKASNLSSIDFIFLKKGGNNYQAERQR